MRKIEIVASPEALAARSVELTVAAAKEAIAARGRFMVALTGGSTPERAYSVLADAKIDWSKTYVFTEDERDVPIDDPRSNFGLAKRTLIDRIDIPPDNVFPMVITPGNPASAAAAYVDVLRRLFPGEAVPSFDMTHLGMGDDGHTASLFPGHPSVDVVDRWVVSGPPGTLPPPVDRVTFTLPLLNAARQVLFLVTGEKKAQTVHEILDENAAISTHPAGGVDPANGTVTWLLDEGAASKLVNARG